MATTVFYLVTFRRPARRPFSPATPPLPRYAEPPVRSCFPVAMMVLIPASRDLRAAGMILESPFDVASQKFRWSACGIARCPHDDRPRGT